MSTKDIRPTDAYIPCDICGRTLLRGERAEVFISGGHRHQVCELCKPRALQEGWVREGALPDYDAALSSQDRRRPMFGRRRRRRGADPAPGAAPATASNLDEALSGGAWPIEPPDRGEGRPRRREAPTRERAPARERPAARERAATRERPSGSVPALNLEPRQVHAVPTQTESKFAAAITAFNASEHPRTVAGVSRSLGAPTVALAADPAHAAVVWIVASWELCWYRYEADLGTQQASVRLDGQGYELSELTEAERRPAAAADAAGSLHLGV